MQKSEKFQFLTIFTWNSSIFCVQKFLKFLGGLNKSQMDLQYKFQLSMINSKNVLHPQMPKYEGFLTILCVLGHLTACFFKCFSIVGEWWDQITPF